MAEIGRGTNKKGDWIVRALAYRHCMVGIGRGTNLEGIYKLLREMFAQYSAGMK